MRRSTSFSVIASLLAAAASAQAPPAEQPPLPPQYEVEVLVFANRDFDPSEELFDQAPNGFDLAAAPTLREAPVFDDSFFAPPEPEPAAPDAVTPAEPSPPPDPFALERAEALRIRLLEPEALKLGNEYRRLQAVAAYTPLVHAGWVQPGLPENEAQAFDLATLGIVNPHGTIRVHLSRFLHITLDLTYRPARPASPGIGFSDALGELELAPRYRLQATRSARSGELHYFDHPAFGVLVRITPVPSDNASGGRRPAA